VQSPEREVMWATPRMHAHVGCDATMVRRVMLARATVLPSGLAAWLCEPVIVHDIHASSHARDQGGVQDVCRS
jgi:hypothetical protein